MSGETSNKPATAQTKGMQYGIDLELSERELSSIGRIVALWGALEHEIFCQTLACLGGLSDGHLPDAMNNRRFSQVLGLWEANVVGSAAGNRRQVLEEQCKRVRHYYDFRNALVHGMWNWSQAAPEKITATRVRDKNVLRTHFTADDLEEFASALETINFKVRWPGGPKELADAMAQHGGHMSRRFFCLITDNPLLDELLPPTLLRGGDKTQK